MADVSQEFAIRVHDLGGLADDDLEQADEVELLPRHLGELDEHALRDAAEGFVPLPSRLTRIGSVAGVEFVEVEIPCESTRLSRPSWVGMEVTQDKTYKNARLVKRVLGELKKKSEDADGKFDEFWAAGHVRLPTEPGLTLLADFRADPGGKGEAFSLAFLEQAAGQG